MLQRFISTSKIVYLNRCHNLLMKTPMSTNVWKTSLKKSWTESFQSKSLQNLKPALKDKDKVVGYWLLSCCGMVSVAVFLGGITRLTESGLSMVTWKFLGEKRPKTRSEWEEEFLKYKQFPEYKMLNSSMTVDEFKFIYLMEYAHRMWGRAIGLCFLVPAFYFWKRGYLNTAIKKRVTVIGLLIGAQGLMGWYMVKSGLEDRFKDVNDVPRVSQYRLASHLSLAFVLHVLCLSSALSLVLPALKLSVVSSKITNFRSLAMITKGIVFFTAVSGAFVAGLDAGLVYNTFPKMADNWVPPEMLSFQPLLRNFTENPVAVQFNHRLLGITTFGFISALYLMGKRAVLPKRAYWALNSLMVVACAQVTLGISTLLNHVPIPLAASHQSGSLLLLSIIVWLNHELKLLKYIPK